MLPQTADEADNFEDLKLHIATGNLAIVSLLEFHPPTDCATPALCCCWEERGREGEGRWREVRGRERGGGGGVGRG